MSKIVNRPIWVQADAAGHPSIFFFHRHQRVQNVLETWEEVDYWRESPLARTVYRVETAAGGLFELELRRPENRWYLYKIYD